MSRRNERALIIIGGHEEKAGERVILREVARRIGVSGKLVVCTAATKEPQEMFTEYERVFRNLGLKHVWHLEVADREQAADERTVRVLDNATGVFFTGGDQLMLTSQMGDTPCFSRTREIYDAGGLLAGTSAGASVMCETMLVSGSSDHSPRLDQLVRMAPGFGFINGIIIDQHFGERGRVGRLLGAVAQNPKSIGVGIDENTAIIVEQERRFTVLGAGTVYVMDGQDISHSNVADAQFDQTLVVTDVRLHLLNTGCGYDLIERRPHPAPRANPAG